MGNASGAMRMQGTRPLVIAICGGSGCGKTTLAEWIVRQIADERVQILSEDNYYRDADSIENFDPGTYNFDDASSKDHALLIDHLRRLRAGREIACPSYDFATHRRQAPTVAIAGEGLIVLEGMHVLQNADIRSLVDLSAFLDVPDDIRLARRLLRDMAERGRDARGVLSQYIGTVRPMHKLQVQPSLNHADIVIRDEELILAGDGGFDAHTEKIGAALLARIRALMGEQASDGL